MAGFTLRTATRHDFAALGRERIPYRNISWAAVTDAGELVGLGGIAFLPDGSRMAFTEMREEARKSPVALHKAGLHCIQYARAAGIKELIACADMARTDVAERWLKRLGFKQEIIRGCPVWKWKNS